MKYSKFLAEIIQVFEFFFNLLKKKPFFFFSTKFQAELLKQNKCSYLIKIIILIILLKLVISKIILFENFYIRFLLFPIP